MGEGKVSEAEWEDTGNTGAENLKREELFYSFSFSVGKATTAATPAMHRVFFFRASSLLHVLSALSDVSIFFRCCYRLRVRAAVLRQ